MPTVSSVIIVFEKIENKQKVAGTGPFKKGLNGPMKATGLKLFDYGHALPYFGYFLSFQTIGLGRI